MATVIRFLASSRTAVFLLVLLALQSLLFVAGPEPLGILKKLGFHKGPSSFPFILVLLLLFVNQLIASVLRLFMLRKRRPMEKVELPPTPSWTEDGEFDELEEQKPRRKILVPRRPLSETREPVQTQLRLGNALALLEILGFRVKELRDQGVNGEEIEAVQGPGTRIATLLLHLGAVSMLGATLYTLGFAPTQSRVLWTGVDTNLGSKVKTPLSKLLNKFKLLKSDTVEFPSYQFKLDSLRAEFQAKHTINRPKDPVKRWMSQVNDLALKPRGLTATSGTVLRSVGLGVSVTAGKHKQQVVLRQGKARLLGPYRVAITQAAVQAELSGSNGTQNITTGKPIQLKDGSKLHLLHFAKGTMRSGQKIAQPCLAFAHRKKSKTLWSGCIAKDNSFKVGGISFQWSQEPREGVVLRYQKPTSFTLYMGSVLLFVLGFLLFWWPRRYKLVLTWSKSGSKLLVEGSGLDAAPHSLALGIEKTLHTDALAAAPRSGGSGGVGGGPQTTPQARPQQTTPQAQQTARPVPTSTPAAPAKPAPTKPATQGQARPQQQTTPQARPQQTTPQARPQQQARPAVQSRQGQARPQQQAARPQQTTPQARPAQKAPAQGQKRPAQTVQHQRPQPQARPQQTTPQGRPAQKAPAQGQQRPKPAQGQQRPQPTQGQARPAQRPVVKSTQKAPAQGQQRPKPAQGQQRPQQTTPQARPQQKAPAQKQQAAVSPPPPAKPQRPKVESRGSGQRPAPKGPAVQQAPKKAQPQAKPQPARPAQKASAPKPAGPKPVAKPAAKSPQKPAAPKQAKAPAKPAPVAAKPQARPAAPKPAGPKPVAKPATKSPQKPIPAKATVPDVRAMGAPAEKPSVSQKAKQQTAPSPFQPKPGDAPKPANTGGSVSKTQVTAKPNLNVGSGSNTARQTDEFSAATITKVVAEKTAKPSPDLTKGGSAPKARSTRPNMGSTNVTDPKRLMTPVPRANTAPMGSTATGAKAPVKKAPPKAAKQDKLDVDSLFEGLGSEKTEVREGGKRVDDKPILQELDIDALFKDFDENIDKKK